MPPKACQGEFIHMMAMPKIRRVSISVAFLFLRILGKCKIPSCEYILLHMLLGAFQGTSRE